MADFTVVPANVLASASAATQTGTAGAGITAGQTLAQDVDGSIKLHDANAAAPLNTCIGIALHASLTGQPITYVKSDVNFQPGFTLAAGDTIICSANPGFMCPDADKAAGWFVTELGHGISTTKMKMAIVSTGVAR